MFNVVLPRLANVTLSLASDSGMLASDPALITDRLAVLAKSASPDLAAAARREEVGRKEFMAGRVYEEPGKSAEERERRYWRLKAYSCSKQLLIRAKAEALPGRFSPDRKTSGCEICPGA